MPDHFSQKIYVHVAGKTVILRDVPCDATVDDVCASWAALQVESGLLERVRASTLKGRALQGCQVINRALGPNPELCLAVTSQQPLADKSETSARGSQEAPSVRHELAAARVESATNGVNHAPETSKSRVGTSPLIGPLLERAADKEASQHYKSAAFIYEQVRAQSRCGMVPSAGVTCCTPSHSVICGNPFPFVFQWTRSFKFHFCLALLMA